MGMAAVHFTTPRLHFDVLPIAHGSRCLILVLWAIRKSAISNL